MPNLFLNESDSLLNLSVNTNTNVSLRRFYVYISQNTLTSPETLTASNC